VASLVTPEAAVVHHDLVVASEAALVHHVLVVAHEAALVQRAERKESKELPSSVDLPAVLVDGVEPFQLSTEPNVLE
jgi:hypothetical protein